MRSLALRFRLTASCAAVLLLACSGSSGDTDDPVGPGGDTPSITLTLGSTTITITQGQSGQVMVTIGRAGGFSGDVTVTPTGLPSGVTSSAITVPAGSTTGMLDFNAAANASAGSNNVTVTAAATGVQSVSQGLGVVIDPSMTSGGNVRFEFCDATGIPDWFAYQDGDGPWMELTPTNNVVEFQMSEPRGGIAYTVLNGQADTNLFYFSTSEIQQIGSLQCTKPAAPKTVNGSIANLGASQTAYVGMGGKSEFVIGGLGSTFTFKGVPDGPTDLVGSLLTVDAGSGTVMTDRLLVRRNLNPVHNETLSPLDFAGEGFDPASAQVTVANVGSDDVGISGFFTTARGSLSIYTIGMATEAVQTYYGFPSSALESGDLHYLQAFAVAPGGGGGGPSAVRLAATMFQEVMDRTITLGPDLATPTVGVAGTSPYVRFDVELPIQSEYSSMWSFTFNQSGPGKGLLMVATAGWLGSATTVDLTVPDFSSVGFNAAWGLQTGATTDWTAIASGWSLPGFVILPGLASGATVRSATTNGQTVP